ncbi:MAG TPA: NADH-quinone oxidoreductase subunit F, partial [Syntrophobacteraceae bacterium]|nr:NADH-quinone oxidoreductase subunit F [Syntrophobacteraceae bacterium]
MMRYERLLQEAKRRSQLFKVRENAIILIGTATCGLAAGAAETKAAFEEVLAERGLSAQIVTVGCIGHCYAEPLVVIHQPGFPGIAYHNVTPGKARALVRSFLEEGDPLFEYVLGATEDNDLIPTVFDFPRFHLEQRLVTQHCGLINPEDLHQYLAVGGYESFIRSLSDKPDNVIREVSQAGL